ncbi:uncharacterized protein BO80DRAFT_465159 [Aspergillus ibericus CBS 121593]|uniref:Uncharacterized protein n=1 Tax=Aspergillus ibericus CBS 121593 TaxID=1448316 RepID=A0A395H372_9EURO|nr:hypothetical protein BO80DRAFT_465159 [Aspergillus ibericus CBS 121593]RAL00684.1 hypothetical protein BO80DRAFT_465159 [Aspergillus ibericus CBS 121593]
MAMLIYTLILGLLGIAWLHILWRVGYDSFLEIYEILHRKGWIRLAEPFLILSMAFTSEASKREQKIWISEWRSIQDKEEETMQRGFYLLDEEVSLFDNEFLDIDPELQTRLAQVQKEHDHIILDLMDLGRDKCHLQDIKPDGAWTRYRSEKPDISLDSEKKRCALRYGCCYRDCGCCEKAREGTFNGNICRLESHCTDFCGCCVRYRESLKVAREPEPIVSRDLLEDKDVEEKTRERLHEPSEPESLFTQLPFSTETPPTSSDDNDSEETRGRPYGSFNTDVHSSSLPFSAENRPTFVGDRCSSARKRPASSVDDTFPYQEECTLLDGPGTKTCARETVTYRGL